MTVGDDEVRHIKRNLVRLATPELARLVPPASWVLGVLLCRGETTVDLATWMRKGKFDPSRVWFYAHPAVDLRQALAAWLEAGFKSTQVDVVASWHELHPLFGLALNDQVYGDFA